MQYAQQLEFKGDYEGALRMFDAAMSAVDHDNDNEPLATPAQLALCKAGYVA